MLFEPLRGFLRRAQYLFLPYSQTDPIHIVTPLVTLMAFAMLLQRRKLQDVSRDAVGRTRFDPRIDLLPGNLQSAARWNHSRLFRRAVHAGACCLVLFWRTIKPAFLETALRLMVVLGMLTSLYGLYQLTFGFPAFEQYWIENTEFYNSISGRRRETRARDLQQRGRVGTLHRNRRRSSLSVSAPAQSAIVRRAAWFVCGAALVS